MRSTKQLPPASSSSLPSPSDSESVVSLIGEVARAWPDAVALASGSRRISYGELATTVDAFAAQLLDKGAGVDVPIAICLDRSIERVIALLGALRAGSAFLPLDPIWPRERLSRVIEDAGAPIVVAGADLGAALAAANRIVLDVDQNAAAVHAPRFPSIRADDLAYLIYTSGSTGEPKGVEITHGNLVNLVAWHRDSLGITPRDRASWIAGLGFDASVWEIFPYLAVGAPVHLPGESIRASAGELRQWLIAEAITIAFVPTPLAEAMIAADWPAQTTLHTLLTGGDTLHVWPKAGLPFKVVNNYGPTECTVVATSGVVQPSSQAIGLPTIGRPIANTRLEILNDAGNRVAPGEIGEVYVAGAGVGRGYRGRPDLSADRFVVIAPAGGPAERFYRTGDLGSWTREGEIAFHGRSDGQLKVRGHRIEPDEISATLSRHPLVAQSAVIAEGEGVDKQLIAYVVPATDTAPRGGELREFLAGSLPNYMLPAVFVRVPALPVTANGKLDKTALPAPMAANTLSSTLYRVPTTPVESRIAVIVEELLGVRGVGMDDNFFMLGGHSLLGTQLVLRLRDTFGAELTLRDLFEAQTIENLAAKVEEAVVAMVASMSEEELQQRLVH